jgi:myo-inositol-1(or 4)-monophosphatase
MSAVGPGQPTSGSRPPSPAASAGSGAPATPSTARADRRALLATCVAAAARAAEIIRDGDARRESLRIELKAKSDFVSEIDRNAEHAIGEVVRSRHGDARLVAEELSPSVDGRAGLVFVADPLDGTTNFLHGFPWYAVSIAALVDGDLAAGAILNVSTGELFTATAGGGARRRGQPISVSATADPSRALIGTGFPFKHGGADVDRYLRVVPSLMLDTAGLRRAGSAALDLACVACGQFDGFFELMLAPWDVAAGILIIREAGGVVTTLDGSPAPVDHTPIVAGSPSIHPWLLEMLAAIA